MQVEDKNKKFKLKVFLSDTFDPWWNLATEKWIFEDMDPDYRILFLWRNDQTVVIGRFQNPWTECNTKLMEETGIKLARRQSGGGAVYQDLGNTNFTFLNCKSKHSKAYNNEIILNALKELGVEADTSGRNDIVITSAQGPKKISGAAFKEKVDRSFHHGTMLIDTNLNKLGEILNPDKKKLESKGIASVRSRVCNLVDINPLIDHDILCESIIREFFKFYDSECPIEILTPDYMKSIKEINQYYEEFKDWQWRFGETPKFNHHLDARFDWGGVDVHLDSHKGKIEQVKIYSDSLHPEMIEGVCSHLIGKDYSPAGVNQAMKEVSLELPMIADYLSEFDGWLSQSIH